MLGSRCAAGVSSAASAGAGGAGRRRLSRRQHDAVTAGATAGASGFEACCRGRHSQVPRSTHRKQKWHGGCGSHSVLDTSEWCGLNNQTDYLTDQQSVSSLCTAFGETASPAGPRPAGRVRIDGGEAGRGRQRARRRQHLCYALEQFLYDVSRQKMLRLRNRGNTHACSIVHVSAAAAERPCSIA